MKLRTWIQFGLIGLLPLLLSHTARAENNCVTCHQSLAPSSGRAHDFKEWKRSVHADKGITCEKCHGGNPTLKDAHKAHQGIVKPGLAESPLYFTKIPETCGACHAAELNAFKQSVHYKELKRSGRGPNCLTCHGSMATTILKPKQLAQSCSTCHAQRKDADEALVNLNLAGVTLKNWEKMISHLKAAGQNTADTEKSYATELAAYHDAQRTWHSFKVGEVTKLSKKIVTVGKKEMQDLQLKKGQYGH